jgi:hypothetical protein
MTGNFVQDIPAARQRAPRRGREAQAGGRRPGLPPAPAPLPVRSGRG